MIGLVQLSLIHLDTIGNLRFIIRKASLEIGVTPLRVELDARRFAYIQTQLSFNI